MHADLHIKLLVWVIPYAVALYWCLEILSEQKFFTEAFFPSLLMTFFSTPYNCVLFFNSVILHKRYPRRIFYLLLTMDLFHEPEAPSQCVAHWCYSARKKLQCLLKCPCKSLGQPSQGQPHNFHPACRSGVIFNSLNFSYQWNPCLHPNVLNIYIQTCWKCS